MCRLICFVCEVAFEMGDQDLPSTLTSLFIKFLHQKLASTTDTAVIQNRQNLARLAQVAWSLGQKQQNSLKSDHFPSKEVKEFALTYSFALPFAFPSYKDNREEEFGSVFSSFIIQNFLGALHLVLAEEVKDKSFTKHLSLTAKVKRSLSWLDLVPRFLPGLLFLQNDPKRHPLLDEEMERILTKKQNTFSKYIKKLEIHDLSPARLLELFHCVHESEDHYLLQHVALRLQSDLSFQGIVLTPPDVYVLHSILTRSKKEFSLDLRSSAIDLQGLKQLVCMKNVTSFRASLSDTVRLWESLQQAKEYELLAVSIEKFTVDPFQAKTLKDVDDLAGLVRMQEKMIHHRIKNASGCIENLCTLEIPAVKNLRQLEFALGPSCGPQGFLKLVEILDAFPSLQHLDLDAPSENEIGDAG
uniref:NACHT LRR and PYD domain-containing protein n=1 Tax=Sphenodon punctatus TaxID=8508 RepID=A0A8D0G8S4_SPHPU